MIISLIINNLALIKRAEFEFQNGFICFTGETGAGKSVLLGALKLLAGHRPDRVALPDDAEKCVIEGLFSVRSEAVSDFLANNDLPIIDGELLIKRAIGKNGSQKISINGSLSTVSVLRDLGRLLIEFNDPTEPQKLFERRFQLELLDEFANLSADYLDYKKSFYDLIKLSEARDEFLAKAVMAPGMLEYVNGQLLEFRNIELTAEWIKKLECDFEKISKRDVCLTHLNSIAKCFESDISGINVSMVQLRNELQRFASVWPDCEKLFERFESIFVELQDVESACIAEQSKFEYDEELDNKVKQNFETLLSLRRKYGSSLDEMIAKRNELETKLIDAENYSERLFEFDDKINHKKGLCEKLAEQLHQKRAAAIVEFSNKITEQLKNLGFKKPVFEIALSRSESINIYGVDSLEFLFSSDDAIRPFPIAKIASSGEMARILLALKTVFKHKSCTPIVVFDEIDANVGGEIGTMVGAQLKALAESSQVFCVTHLPQVASKAAQHISVKKISCESGVNIEFEQLNTEENRLTELARMLGDSTSASAKQHAISMLKS